MALSYIIDSAARLVRITGEPADEHEWRDALTALVRDPRYQPGFALLRDIRRTTRPAGVATVIRVIEVLHEFWPTLGATRVAILAPRHMDAEAVVAHAYADQLHLPLRAFTSPEGAYEWLADGAEGTIRSQ